jgi:voltage-gated potassium channel
MLARSTRHHERRAERTRYQTCTTGRPPASRLEESGSGRRSILHRRHFEKESSHAAQARTPNGSHRSGAPASRISVNNSEKITAWPPPDDGRSIFIIKARTSMPSDATTHRSQLLRTRVYALLNVSSDGERTHRARHIVQTVLVTLIVLNVAIVILESMQEIEGIATLKRLFTVIDWISVAVFSVEYLLRIWTCIEDHRYGRLGPTLGRLRYMVSPFGMIDLMAVLPFYLHTVFVVDLRMLRGLRLLRLERILTLGHYSRSFSKIISVIERKRVELVMSFALMFIIMLMASSVMFFLEHDAQPEKFANIPVSMWWGVVTLTTVGYGDIVPMTALGKVCSAVIALISIGLVAIPSSILVNGFYELHNESSDNVRTELDKELLRKKVHVVATHQESLEPFGTRVAIATSGPLGASLAVVHGVHGHPIRIVRLDSCSELRCPAVVDHQGRALPEQDARAIQEELLTSSALHVYRFDLEEIPMAFIDRIELRHLEPVTGVDELRRPARTHAAAGAV